jgi:ribosomal protein S18 acetylase RimI-like enzyme
MKTVNKIIKASLDNISVAAPLFDAYRVFYKKPSDIKSAESFLYNRIKNQESVIFLYFHHKQEVPVGFTQLYPSFSSVGMNKIFILNDLYVDESYRKQGVGRELMHYANKFAIENGAAKLTLETAKTNLSAQKLYTSEGYQFDDEYTTMELNLQQEVPIQYQETKIIKASLDNISVAAPLFDAYRVFYKKPSDIKSAESFLYNRIKNQESEVFIYLDKNQETPIGFIQLYPSFSSVGMNKIFILNDLYVDESYRKQGVGRELMHYANKFAIENGAVKLTLETAKTNLVAQKLYISEGYQFSDEYITMELNLYAQISMKSDHEEVDLKESLIQFSEKKIEGNEFERGFKKGQWYQKVKDEIKSIKIFMKLEKDMKIEIPQQKYLENLSYTKPFFEQIKEHLSSEHFDDTESVILGDLKSSNKIDIEYNDDFI